MEKDGQQRIFTDVNIFGASPEDIQLWHLYYAGSERKVLDDIGGQ